MGLKSVVQLSVLSDYFEYNILRDKIFNLIPNAIFIIKEHSWITNKLYLNTVTRKLTEIGHQE